MPLPTATASHVDTARRYLQALERGAPFAELAEYLHAEVRQIEYPNRLVPAGASRSFADLAASRARGLTVVRDERYEIRQLIAEGDAVAVRLSWSATPNVPIGKTPPGGSMSAEFAIFLRFRDDKIVEQHNYDCFREF